MFSATATGIASISSTDAGGKVSVASSVSDLRIPVSNAIGTSSIKFSVDIDRAAAMGVFVLRIAGPNSLLFVTRRKYTQTPITVIIMHGTKAAKTIPRTVPGEMPLSLSDTAHHTRILLV